ncbi:MAG: hypothetical protein HN580_01460 [Deltaproteobacteria bacterium]|nr:hypothetical protein [Deltaproteobacteria bacterium]MBT4640455.1 hypothetical protein [Deltaproteobacteria bacterium]MBT6615967.1 hypothetical protein [Deltaproteobacteria bacterium]MBT7154416.1 hypothetical protein [Deltaproteobacteria bacterium]MBT7710412.1 hypothetical protein [Deltaproteobacteria bacterium]
MPEGHENINLESALIAPRSYYLTNIPLWWEKRGELGVMFCQPGIWRMSPLPHRPQHEYPV